MAGAFGSTVSTDTQTVTKVISLKPIAEGTALTTGDAKMQVRIPIELNGMNLVSVGMHVYTTSSSGLPTVQIRNVTDAVDMLSTKVSVDVGEIDSSTATTPPVINTAVDDVATGDILAVDVDIAGTGTAGLEIDLGFRQP